MIATNDSIALLRALLETPEDDALRLVYADWLQENGQAERAEFIRVQCELARLKYPDKHYHWHGHGKCDGCIAKRLRRREAKLWNAPLILRELPDASIVEVRCSIVK